jgi:putative ABC transport system permease protein
VIGVLLTVPVWWSGLILLGMMGGATWISRQRGAGVPGVTTVSFVAIAVGAGLVIVTMTWARAIEPTVRSLVPVGSLVIANAMKINGLALNRLKDELRDKRAEIEVGLSLGGPPGAVLARHLRTSVQASLIPVIDSLKSLGWVWIPGIMAGMILGGENPIYAALYQFVIMAMIFAAGGLTSIIASLLVRRHVITRAEQLRRIPAGETEESR